METQRPTFEVQDPQTLLWYTAHIVDKQKESFTIRYLDPLLKEQEEIVEEARIHYVGHEDPVQDLEYKEGDYIEVKHRQSEEDPFGWCLARIITKRDQFFFVHYEHYDNIYDEIILIDQIRPVNTRVGPRLEETDRVATTVPAAILNWCIGMDAEEKFATVVAKTGVHNVSFRPNDGKIVIVGPSKAVSKASILLNFIIDHQCELVELEKENAKISKTIESKRQKILKSDSVEEIIVPRDLLGLIIGKGGANIAFYKQEYQVGIHIIEAGEADHREYTETEIPEDKALIRIYGKNPEWVKLAKREIYLQRTMVPIEADKIDYIKGYSNTIVNDMKEKSGCVKVFVQDPKDKNSKESQIEVIANEDAFENFKLLLDTHLTYYDTYQLKEYQNRELNKQMNKYNANYGEGFQGGDNRGGYGGQNKKRNKNKNY